MDWARAGRKDHEEKGHYLLSHNQKGSWNRRVIGTHTFTSSNNAHVPRDVSGVVAVFSHSLGFVCFASMRSSGSTPPAHSAPSSQPSVTKLLLNFSHSFILSIKRAFHPQITPRSASNNTDINLLVTTILLILSLISSWVLILAFLSLLPVIYSQLLAAQLPAAIPSSNKQNIVDPNVSSSSLSDTNNSSEPFQEGMGTVADAATVGSQKKKLSAAVPVSENVTSPGGGKKHRKAKKKVAKETWGLPTLRVIDSNGKVVPVNPDTPTPMETDCFKGFILIMLKCDGEHEEHDRYKHHFKGKQRKFEVQFQVFPSSTSALLTALSLLVWCLLSLSPCRSVCREK
jgi:hypothetical protein